MLQESRGSAVTICLPATEAFQTRSASAAADLVQVHCPLTETENVAKGEKAPEPIASPATPREESVELRQPDLGDVNSP
jgi:hypothetical protein